MFRVLVLSGCLLLSAPASVRTADPTPIPPVPVPVVIEIKASLSGPAKVEVGAPLILNPAGSVAPGGLEFGLAQGPGPAPIVTLKSDDGKTVIGFGTAAAPGAYQFYVIAWGPPGKTARETPKQLAFWTVIVGEVPPPTPPVPPGPVPPVSPVQATAATYVYEKDQHAIPNQVLSALNRLNRERGMIATAIEADAKDGTGQVPDQYKVPFAAAKEAGLPALVVTGGGKVLAVVKDPKTERQVLEVIK